MKGIKERSIKLLIKFGKNFAGFDNINNKTHFKLKDGNSCLGCLVIIVIGFFILCFIGSLFDESDEYDTFIENTTSKSKTPWEYLPNKDVGYCVNTDIDKTLSDSILETYCAKDYSTVEAFSNCINNKTELMFKHAQELVNLSEFMKINYLPNKISDYEAADRAAIFLCGLKSAKVFELKKDYLEKDIQKIRTGKEEAKELKVSYKCYINYKNNKKTTECTEAEIKNIENK